MPAGPGWAQAEEKPESQASPVSLRQLVGEAIRQRPLLEASEARIDAAQARVTQAHAAQLPRVEFQASLTEGPTGAPPLFLGGVVGTPLKKRWGASFNLTQTLLDFGRAYRTVLARRAEVDGAREALRADENRVALEVQQAYFQALQAQRLIAVNRQIVEQRRLVARQAEILRENGLATRLDVDLAQLNVAQAELAVVRAQNDVASAFATLGAAAGRDFPTDTLLEDVAPAVGAEIAPAAPVPAPGDATPLPSLDESMATALQERPELRQLEAQTRVNQRLAQAAAAGNRPQLVGVVSLGKINPVEFAPTNKFYALGAGLTVPIFTGGLVRGQVEEARSNAAVAQATREDLALQIRQQVTSALANLAASEEGLRVGRVQLVQAQDALRLATQRYEAQLGNIVELTQAQVGYAQAQNDFIRSLYDRQLAEAALNFATGRGFRAAAGSAGRPESKPE